MKKAAPKAARRSKPLKARDHGWYVLAFGYAVMELWPRLPQKIQKTLFEAAVVSGHQDERDELLREQLALFLHTRHPRTERKRA